MECDKERAIKARETAEKKMLMDDFQESRRLAVEAKELFPQLENISQLLAVCDVHCSSQKRICGSEKDWYEILQIGRLADESTIKKQYRKLALLLHPDKNKFPGAEAAFKLVGEANMVLSDIKRRLYFDAKHRASEIAAVPKAPPPQKNRNSVVKKAKKANTNPDVSTKANNKPPTTPDLYSFMASLSCPLCKFQYIVRPVHRVNHCPNCFRANIFGPQGVPPVSNQNNIRAQGNNVVSQQKQVPVQASRVPVQSTGKFTNSELHSEANPGKTFVPNHVKQTGGTNEIGAETRKHTYSHVRNEVNLGRSSGAEGMKRTTEVNGGGDSRVKDVDGRDDKAEVAKPKVLGTSANKNRKKRKLEADSSESYDMSISDDEETSFKGSKGNPTASQNLGQESMHSTRRSSRQRKNISYNESAGVDDDFNMSPCHSKAGEDKETFSTDKQEATSTAHVPPAAVVDEYPDPEFTDFDKIRKESCFSVNQIWACYDTVDGMPRFYAKIRKVCLPESKLSIAWLEADPEKQEEIEWADEDLPVGCGKFMCVDTEETIDCHTLSHQVGFEKVHNKDTYFIYPRKGETWALFKDWDIGWSSEPDSHAEYKFELVEVLSDFCHDIGIKVGFLVKIKGFVSLFQQTSEGAASVLIPSNELLRFSHQVPSFKMTGSEGAGVPQGSFELDPAALPSDPDAV